MREVRDVAQRGSGGEHEEPWIGSCSHRDACFSPMARAAVAGNLAPGGGSSCKSRREGRRSPWRASWRRT